MQYPTGFESDDIYGHGIIFQGHGWSKEYCLKMIYEWDRAMLPEEDEVAVVKEWYYKFYPRVMWCQKYDTFPCDNVGTWHPHWSMVGPTEDLDKQFTVVYIVER